MRGKNFGQYGQCPFMLWYFTLLIYKEKAVYQHTAKITNVNAVNLTKLVIIIKGYDFVWGGVTGQLGQLGKAKWVIRIRKRKWS